MPKTIDPRLIEAAKKAYLTRNPRPTLKAIAAEFAIGLSTLKALSSKGKWAEIRKSKAAGAKQGAIAVATARAKVSDLDVLENAIAIMAANVATTEARSKEGCASALGSLLKAKRELYPPTADGLAEMAVGLGITPADFLAALKSRWDGELGDGGG